MIVGELRLAKTEHRTIEGPMSTGMKVMPPEVIGTGGVIC